MKKAAYLVILVAAVTVAFVIGSQTSHLGATPSGADRSIQHYACPMHPTYTSPVPGTAPCCGMKYEPVYADNGSEHKAGSEAPLGTVHVPAPAGKAIGLQVREVGETGGDHAIRLFGRVAVDERRVFALNAGIEGTIYHLSAATTGSRVRKGELLGTYTAPELLMTVQQYILAVDGYERRQKGELSGPPARVEDEILAPVVTSGPNGLVVNSTISALQQRIERLRLLGMSEIQMEEIRKARGVPPFIKIISPTDGIVLARNAALGRTFGRGEEWFRIGDLRKVWVFADVFGDDAARVRPGMTAKVMLSGDRRTFTGRVSEVPPQYNPETRTRTVRLDVDNAGDVLRPEMLVDVELAASFDPAIVVPSESVLDNGLSRVVFVEREPGAYEPRQVETGWRRDGQIEIVSGLKAGDRIVVSGTFLLDSDSRIRLATGQ
jgi:Cu(I)/Ag(I) efflux system membrane fusion protein